MYHWREFSFSGNRVTFEVSLVVEVAVTAPDSLPCSVLSLEQQLCCCCHHQWGGSFFVLIEDLFLLRKCTKKSESCLSLFCTWCFRLPLSKLQPFFAMSFFFLQRLSLLNLNNKNCRTNLPVSEKNCKLYRISAYSISHL